MEFPDLGDHCSEKTCKQLDFLPMKCDSCSLVFCLDHFQYKAHSCEKAYLKDVQVPICPLCNQPVPVKRGETPDKGVNEHIENDCSDDRAMKKRNLVYKNRCSRKGCRQKELIPVVCGDCRLNFCLKHRHPIDHNCDPRLQRIPKHLRTERESGKSPLREHNVQKEKERKDNNFKISHIHGNLSEDEALARALQQSMMETNHRKKSPPALAAAGPANMQEEEDRMLAQAIAESQREHNRNKDRCSVS